MHRFALVFALCAAACGDNRGGNTAPDVSNLSVTTEEDMPAMGTLTIVDADGDNVTITLGPPSHGDVTKTGSTFTYTPDANYNGDDSFTVTVSDGTNEDTATVSITITPVNDAPAATADSFATNEDSPHTANFTALLANDVDVDGDTLTITSVGNTTNGTAAIVGTAVVFTPTANFSGSGTYRYTVSDGTLTADATVTVTIGGVNDPPVAVDDTGTTAEDTDLVVASSTLVANDTDGENQTLSVTAVTSGTGGTVSLAGGDITFVPTANFNGDATYTYTVSDGADTDTGTVTVTVTAVNDAPVAVADAATTNEDTAVTITQATAVANDTDVDAGTTLTVTAVSNATNGSVSLTGGDATFTPDADFNGTASYDYTVSDGAGGTSTGTVTITVAPVNDAPVAVDDAVSTPFNTPLTITNASLLANDTDVDVGDTRSITAVQNAQNGSVAAGATSITFTPDTGFSGTASFEYVVTDAGGASDVGLVMVTVVAGNAKAITSFVFTAALNSDLTTDATGTINEGAGTIAVTVPFGTDVTNLVATFVQTGASVTVGGVTQVSGTTSNSFAAPVVYRVTAQDASTKDYTVTVTIAPNTAKAITAYAFLDATNPALTVDVTATIDEANGTIAATVPFGTNVGALVATFTTTGSSVTVGGTTQVSGTTANDFTSTVTYVVTAADTSTKNYVVTVTIAPNPAKDITSFSFLMANNPGLTADVTGTIGANTITATIPGGANGAALVATFTHTGQSVTVGGVTQVSGTTANDFTSNVVYTVTAADTTTKQYTVTLTINCETLAAPTDGTVAFSNGNVAPATATYACNRGYSVSGSATRSCTAGTYAGTAPTCTRRFMVLRAGDGSAVVSTTASAAFIEERDITSTTALNTFAVPTAAAGANNACTLSGSSTSDGQLQLSTNSQYVTFGGYVAPVGTVTVASTTNLSTDATPTNRCVARIDGDGGVDTSTRLLGVFSGSNIRSVHSVDGTSFWAAGNGSVAGPGGVNFVALGSTGANTNLTGNVNLRHAHISDGQLYVGAAAAISTVGTGVPTTSPQTLTSIGLTLTNAAGFVVLDRSPVVAGVDTIYLARDGGATADSINVVKLTFDGTAWSQATFAVTFTGAAVNASYIAAWPEGANLRLVAVQTSANSNRIVTFVDDGSASVAATLVGTAPTNMRFMGVAPAPTVAP